MTSPFWPGTTVPKSQGNAFTAHLTAPGADLRKQDRDAETSRRSSARVTEAARAGVKLARIDLNAPPRNGITLTNRKQSEAQRDRTAEIRRSGL